MIHQIKYSINFLLTNTKELPQFIRNFVKSHIVRMVLLFQLFPIVSVITKFGRSFLNIPVRQFTYKWRVGHMVFESLNLTGIVGISLVFIAIFMLVSACSLIISWYTK